MRAANDVRSVKVFVSSPVDVPRAAARAMSADPPSAPTAAIDVPAGQLVVVIEDELLGSEGMCGLLRSWGLRVVAARDGDEARMGLGRLDQPPDLIISDYQLLDGETGIDVIDALRREFGARVPAFLISGDTSPEKLLRARASGYHLLHKPVPPMRLRAMVSQSLKTRNAAEPTVP